MRRWNLTACLLFLWTASALAQQPQEAADEVAEHGYQRLAELTRAAERNSPGVQAARHNIAAADALLSEAKGSPFFQFTATGVFGVAPNVRGTPLYSQSNNQIGFGADGWNVVTGADVSGAIPLYTWGKLEAARDAARAGVDAAEGGRDRVLAKLRFDVRRAYFALQFSLDILQLISEGKGKLVSAVERLRRQIEDGEPDARPEDMWRLSSALAEIEAGEAEARQLEASSRAALALLTGIDEITVIDCPSQAIPYELKPVDHYRDAARLNRPEGRMLDSAVRARKSAKQAAKARYFPDLALVLGMGRTWAPGRTDQLNPFSFDPANRGSFNAGLAARWSLDFWGTHYKVEKAEAELDATEAMRVQADDGMALEVTAAYEKVKATQATEEAWERGRRDTRSWFLAATQAYQVGANEPKDVVDAVRAYFKARGAHLDAIRAHNTGIAELERTAGAPLLQDDDAWEPRCD